MELTGEIIIDAPRERVWSALNDAATLQACIPGCEEVIDESPTVRRARVMIKVGPVRARFSGRVTLSEVEPLSRCVMSFEGSGGAAGMASGQSQVELHETTEGTRLAYTVKASIGGKLGQIGGRMIDASAKQLADQFFAALGAHLRPVTAEESTGEGSAVADAVAGEPVASVTGASNALAPIGVVAPSRSQPPTPQSELTRIVWFLMGVASTGFGVWLGARLL